MEHPSLASGTVWVAVSKNGKGRHVVLTEEGQTFFKWMIRNRPPDDLIFRRADGRPWGKSHQRRPLLEACKRAEVDPPASFHILRHTHASHLAMNGTPLYVIAHQLGHADTRMAEKHYAHLAPSYVAETIRRGFPRIGMGKGKVLES